MKKSRSELRGVDDEPESHRKSQIARAQHQEVKAIIRARDIADHDAATALKSAEQKGLQTGEERGLVRGLVAAGFAADKIAESRSSPSRRSASSFRLSS